MAVKNTYVASEKLPAQDVNDIVTSLPGFGVYQQATPDLTLKITGGVANINGTVVKYAGGNSPSFTAPSANPRIDLLTIDTSGTVARVAGTEAASPTVPDYPTQVLVIAEVYNNVGQTQLYDSDQGAGKGYVYRVVRAQLGSGALSLAFELDGNSDAEPTVAPTVVNDPDWELDANGDVQPTPADVLTPDNNFARDFAENTNMTPAEAEQLRSAGFITGLHFHKKGQIVSTRNLTAATATVAYAHNLGVAPKWVKVTAIGFATSSMPINSFGSWTSDGVYGCAYIGGYVSGSPVRVVGNSTTVIASCHGYQNGSDGYQDAVVASVDASNINLTWTKNNSPTITNVQLLIEYGV